MAGKHYLRSFTTPEIVGELMRRKAMVEVCSGCGLNPEQDHTDIVHDDGSTEFAPMYVMRED